MNLKEYIRHAELFEVHGGHFMWVGKDKDEIWKKRLEFLDNLPK